MLKSTKHAWIVSAALAAACGGDAAKQTPSQTGASNMAMAGSPSSAAAGSTSTPRSSASAGISGSGQAGKSAAAAAGTSTAGSSGSPAAPTFSAVYSALFSQVAAPGCFGCHGGMANPALNGNFSMVTSKAAAYAGLVGAMSSDAAMCKGMTRVKAGDPMSSLLYLKIAAAPACGMRMPPGDVVAAETVTLVKDWIAAGAMDN